MRITAVEPFILHVPLTYDSITDSTHRITHWGVVGTRVLTADGRVGYGFTGTHAHLPGDRLITDCIARCYAPLLVGEESADIARLWRTLAREPAMQWIGRSGITQLALAAVDVALWDLAAKRARLPLWQLLGGATCDAVMAYNTDVGWLSIPDEQLVAGCRRAVEELGFRGIKIKVGSADPSRDLRRLEAVRRAIGDGRMLAIDGNGRWDVPTCLRFCRAAQAFDVYWFEEPTWYDDVAGHAELARASAIPVALGEQLYSLDAFQAFFAQRALHYVQPDVTRLGGISEFIQVADAAHALRLPVCPHAGDMSQVHVHLAYWHPATTQLEWIPWIKDCFEEPAEAIDGDFVRPQQPGAGTTPKPGILERFGRPLA